MPQTVINWINSINNITKLPVKKVITKLFLFDHNSDTKIPKGTKIKTFPKRLYKELRFLLAENETKNNFIVVKGIRLKLLGF